VRGRERRLVALVTAAAAAAAAPSPVRAQTMLDQEQRLIDIHSLLLDLPPLQSPGALPPGRLSAGLEAVTIPDIDGQTGGKVQITASDRTPVFPRPRVAFGLPAPEGFRAMVGISYIPPFAIRDVSTHYGAAEAGRAATSCTRPRRRRSPSPGRATRSRRSRTAPTPPWERASPSGARPSSRTRARASSTSEAASA
jgi:hypothetical protein